MMDIATLLASERPSNAQVEAEAQRLAEATILTRTARELAEDLNVLMHELATRGF